MREPPGRSGRTRASKQNLIGVDIADTCDDPLVDQKGLERSAAASEGDTEPGHVDVEGVGPEVVELSQTAGGKGNVGTGLTGSLAVDGARGGEEELSEGPGVDEPELPCVIERHHGVGMREQRIVGLRG